MKYPTLPFFLRRWISPRPRLGLVVHGLSQRQLLECIGLGVNDIRTTIYDYEWRDPSWDRDLFDANIQQAIEAGINVTLCLHGRPQTLTHFENFIVEVHDWFPGSPIQLWNEIDANFWGHFNQYFRGEIEEYCDHIERVRQRLPHAELVSSGLATSGEDLARWVSYLDKTSINAIALHTYGWPLVGPYRDKYRIASALTNKPIWNTEFGMEAAVLPPGFGDRWPSDQTRQLLACAKSGVPYRRRYIYALYTGAGHSLTPESKAWLREWNRKAL